MAAQGESALKATGWEGELFGLAEEDLDLDREKIVRVRRQVKKLGPVFVSGLPKNDSERIIPLSDWDITVIRRHIAAYPPRPYTLPWEKPEGNLLFPGA